MEKPGIHPSLAMSLLHSCLVARVRRPAAGEPTHVTLAECNNISGEGTASAPVVAVYQALMGNTPQAIEDRRKYSHIVLIVDNGMRANHEFPDLDAAEAKREHVEATRAAAAEAKAAEKTVATLAAQLAEAEAEQSRAAAKLAHLTGAPVDPPAPAEPVEGDEKHTAPAGEPEGGKKTDDEGDPVEKMAARLEASEPVTADELSVLTVPQLKTLADRYGIEIPAHAKKDEVVALILGIDPNAP